MSNTIKRWIPRLIHLIFSIPIIDYVYSPFEELPNINHRRPQLLARKVSEVLEAAGE